MNNLLYCSIEDNQQLSSIIAKMDSISAESPNPVYIIDKPLGNEDKSFDYDYKEKAIILSPKLKIILVNCGVKDDDDFELFANDFEDDLDYLSKKFGYQKYLGRKRNWNQCITCIHITEIESIGAEEFLNKYAVPVPMERIVELLISLLIGSINDIDKIGIEVPETLLDKVKKKIVLFDGMQSRFVYEKTEKKQVKIQGLAGTGKTELLLHKLKETYVGEKESRIAFTCHNKVLARDMRERIPQFFNFMKVEEQIAWDERLWVFPSWGSRSVSDSGFYSYICQKYGISFKRYSEVGTFDDACKLAVSELKQFSSIIPCFDYVFIDESQDFSENFFELCNLVTSKQIYIAGDIFQDVFDSNIKASVSSDYLLNKCYRTDPKTLMLAHSIGMGLYEQPVIRWLDDDEWEACGYLLQRNKGEFSLKRSPLRRFEDVDMSGFSSISLIKVTHGEMVNNVLQCMQEIITENATVKAEDIAIILLGNSNTNYSTADRLSFEIAGKFGWESTKGYISKTKEKGKVFISNVNNVKGLEFPFIICVETGVISKTIQKRNSIYMALTRSFLSSYFLVDEVNEAFISIYQEAIKGIKENGYMILREPGEAEKMMQAEKVRIEAGKKRSLEDIVNEACDEYPSLSKSQRQHIQRIAPDFSGNLDEEEISMRVHKIIHTILGIKPGDN